MPNVLTRRRTVPLATLAAGLAFAAVAGPLTPPAGPVPPTPRPRR